MKAVIGRRHPDRLILHQLDVTNRTWTTTYLPRLHRPWWRAHPAAIVCWLIVSALFAYVIIQAFDAGLRH